MRIGKLDRAKMREFVTEGLMRLGGRLVRTNHTRSFLAFEIAGCDVGRLEDFVNQRMGHYAYPWTSWKLEPTVLAVGAEEYD
jgi:hypothetical protein